VSDYEEAPAAANVHRKKFVVKSIAIILLCWTITVEDFIVENLIASLCLLARTKGQHCACSFHRLYSHKMDIHIFLTGWILKGACNCP